MTSPRLPRITVVEFLPSGGMFQFAQQMAQALAASGAEVTLLTGPDPEVQVDVPRLRVLAELPTWNPNDAASLSGTGSGPLARLRTLSRRGARAARLVESWRRVVVHLRRTRPDVVQFGELRFGIDRLGLLAVARACDVDVVDVAHNPLPFDVSGGSDDVEKGGRLTRWSLDRAYRACDLVLTLGDGPRRQLLEEFPDVRRSAVIGHGQYDAFRVAEPPAPSACGPRLLFFGTWTRYKNLPLLLDAFERVRATHPEAELTVAGAPMPDVDVDLLRRRADGIGGVDLRPGYVPVDELGTMFSSARAVVAPYSVVNISGVVHMASTFGRPVVATDVGAMSDVVLHGRTGLLTASDPDSLAAALRRLLDEPATADLLGRQAREVVEASSSWGLVAGRALDAYAAIPRRRHPAAVRTVSGSGVPQP